MKTALILAAASAALLAPDTAGADVRVRIGARASFEVSVVPAFYLGWRVAPPPPPPQVYYAPPPPPPPQVDYAPPPPPDYPQVSTAVDPCSSACAPIRRVAPRSRFSLGAFAGVADGDAHAAGLYARWSLGRRLQLHGEIAELGQDSARYKRAGAGLRLALRPGRRLRPYGIALVGAHEDVAGEPRYHADGGLGIELALTRRLSLQGEYRWTAHAVDDVAVQADDTDAKRTPAYMSGSRAETSSMATVGLTLRL